MTTLTENHAVSDSFDDAGIADDLELLARLRDVHAPAALEGDPEATRLVLRILEARQRLRRFRDQRRAAAEKARQAAAAPPPSRSEKEFPRPAVLPVARQEPPRERLAEKPTPAADARGRAPIPPGEKSPRPPAALPVRTPK